MVLNIFYIRLQCNMVCSSKPKKNAFWLLTHSCFHFNKFITSDILTFIFLCDPVFLEILDTELHGLFSSKLTYKRYLVINL